MALLRFQERLCVCATEQAVIDVGGVKQTVVGGKVEVVKGTGLAVAGNSKVIV